ncbi:hypothetical protein AMECASPLE_027327 [Ameca splendens]|uniref:Uncharacterized protein n=1 Tax=Ameca splendens TaxID=208324 RepID=A0ABV0YSL9_9TELE
MWRCSSSTSRFPRMMELPPHLYGCVRQPNGGSSFWLIVTGISFFDDQLFLYYNRPEQRLHYSKQSPSPSVYLPFNPTIIREKDTWIPKLMQMRQRLTLNPEGAVQHCLAKNHGLRLGLQLL